VAAEKLFAVQGYVQEPEERKIKNRKRLGVVNSSPGGGNNPHPPDKTRYDFSEGVPWGKVRKVSS